MPCMTYKSGTKVASADFIEIALKYDFLMLLLLSIDRKCGTMFLLIK